MAKRPDPRLSHQALKVLKVFIEGPKEGLAGSDIWKTLGLFTGTVYPILLRLETAGWLNGKPISPRFQTRFSNFISYCEIVSCRLETFSKRCFARSSQRWRMTSMKSSLARPELKGFGRYLRCC